MRTAEEGLYGVPGVFASVATVMTPGVGPAAMYLAMEDFAYRDLRDNLKRDGMGEAEASDIANRYKSAAAIPQTALEIVQTYAPLGKLPAVNRALIKLGDGIKNRLVRGAVKAGAISAAETITEEGQFLTTYAVQEIAAAFEKDMPDGNWTGEGGAFDGFWTRQATVFISMLPLAMGGAAGGLNREARAAAFSRASTTELQAFGITADGIAAINGARGQSSLNEAVDTALAGRDANTPEAQAAVEVLAAEQADRQATLEAAKASGMMPDIIGNARDGYTVLDGETKEELATGLDRDGAVRFATAHSAALDETNADRIAYLTTLLQAGEEALAMAGDANATTSAELGTLYTEAVAAAENPASIDQFAAQAADKEVVSGGTGEVTRVAIGRNVAEVRGQVRTFTNRLFQGSSVRTVVHETGHGMLRRAWESGAVTREETLQVVQAINAAMGERKLKKGAFAGEALALLYETAYAAADAAGKDRMLHEAVAEIMEAEVMRTRKRVIDQKSLPMSRGVVTRGVFSAALLRLSPKLAGKFKALVEAVRGVVGLSSARALAMKKAIREGTLQEADIESFMDKLTGRDHQAEHNAMASEEAAALVGEAELEADADFEADEDNPFSLAPAPADPEIPYGVAKAGNRVVKANPDAASQFSKLQATITSGTEIFGDAGVPRKSKVKDIISAVREWGVENGLFGDHPLPCLNDHVRITGNSIVHDLSHQAGPEKIESVSVLPGMLKNAVWVQTELSDNALKSHVLASKLEIAGREITVSIVVRESNGKLFYDHELLTNKEGDPTDEQRPGVNVRRAQSEEAPSAGKVVTKALDVKSSPLSLAPSAMVDSMSLNAAARIKDPRAKAAVFTRMLDKLGQLKRDKDELGIAFGKGYKRKAIEDPRKTASIRKERNFREAARRAELEDLAHARYGDLAHDEDLIKIKAQLGHELLSVTRADGSVDPRKGRLMSLSKATSRGKNFFDPDKQGDYDGAGDLSRSVFGGDLMPDQAAKELFEAGLIKADDVDLMWELLKREQRSVNGMKESYKAMQEDVRKARLQAKEEAAAWEWEAARTLLSAGGP